MGTGNQNAWNSVDPQQISQDGISVGYNASFFFFAIQAEEEEEGQTQKKNNNGGFQDIVVKKR